MTPDECRSIFLRDFSKPLREELLRGIMAAYPVSWEAAQSFTDETGAEFQPQYRRALVRDTVQAIGRRYEGVVVENVPTQLPGATYLQLESGQSVLTIAHVDRPTELPKYARHRATLAANPGECFSLFPADAKDDETTYGILLYGPPVNSDDIRHVPAFVSIGIPSPDYDCYMGEQTWSLYEEFPHVVEEVTGVRPIAIAEAQVHMRRVRTRRGMAG